MIAALSESSGQAASDFSGCTGDQDFHGLTIAAGASPELEETDMPTRLLCATETVQHNPAMHDDRAQPPQRCAEPADSVSRGIRLGRRD